MKRALKLILKIFLWLISGIVVVCVAISLSIQIPAVQDFVIDKATTFISGKTKTKIEIGHIKIIFPTSVSLADVYLEDKNRDTLAYIHSLDVSVNIFSLLHKEVNISSTNINDLHAHIYRGPVDSSFNYSFILDAFSAPGCASEPSVKDTTAAPWAIHIGDISLHQIRLVYLDSLSGTMLKSTLGSLAFEPDNIDLKKMRFEVDLLKISNTSVDFQVLKAAPPSTTTGDAIAMYFSAGKLELDSVQVNYRDQPGGQSMNLNIAKTQIRTGSFDMATQTAKAGRFELINSQINMAMTERLEPKIEQVVEEVVTLPSKFNVYVEKINLQKNQLHLDLDTKPVKKTGIDFQHLHVTEINLKANKTHYKYQNIKTEIESFSVYERSGLSVRHLSAKVAVDSVSAQLQNLYLATGHSKATKYLGAWFSSWDDFQNHPDRVRFKADIQHSIIDLRDIIRWQPSLASQEIIKSNLRYPIRIHTLIEGRLGDMCIRRLHLGVGKNTSLVATGQIKGLPDIDKSHFDIKLHALRANHHDLHTFLPLSMAASFRLPDTVSIQGAFKGMMTHFDANLNAVTSDGTVIANVRMKGNRKLPDYEAVVDIKNLNVGKILRQTPMMGRATLNANVKGKGFSLPQMDVNIDAAIDSFFINNYTYTHTNIDGNIKNKLFEGHLDIQDPNLNLVFDGKVNMNKKVNQYSFDMNVLGADLQNLKISTTDINVSIRANADIKAPAFDKINGNASIRDIVLYSEGKKYEVDSLLFVSFNDDKRNSLEVNSAVFKAKFDGNISLNSLPATLSNHFNYYFKTTKNKPVSKPEHFNLEIDINNSPLIYEVLIPNLNGFIPGKIKGSFDSEAHKLDFDASIITMDYAGNKIDNFAIAVHSDKEALHYAVGVDQFSNSQFSLEKTLLAGSVRENLADINLAVAGKDKDKLTIHSQIQKKENGVFHFNILPQGFAINNEAWSVPDSNFIEFGKNGLYFQNMILENKDQYLSVISSTYNKSADLNVSFSDFQLLTLSQIIETKDPIVRGKLDGSIIFKDYHHQMAFISSLIIDEAQYRRNNIGLISLHANNLQDNKYALAIGITGNENDIMLNGYLQSQAKGMNMDLDLQLTKLNLSSFQGFVSGQATDLSGYASGGLKVTGQTAAPQVNGEVRFNEAVGKISFLNQYLKINEGKISIDPHGIYFPNLIIHDAANNKATINGQVGMKELADFKFNLDVQTDNFVVMNSTRKNNKMLNGKMIVSSKIKIRGNMAKPKIDARVKLVDGSKVCFTVPENQLNADKGEGVVEFDIDTLGLHPIIRRAALKKKMVSDVRGINIASNIELNRQSTLKLVLDPTQADTLIVQGDAHLSFALDESGKMSLTGTYVVANGSYQLSFQEIVQKKFLINKGSTITWNGDPLDALIDITAQHNVKTSPADLLASGSGGRAAVDPGAAKNALNFYIQIFIRGQLLNPNLKFRLEMDPAQQQALGGTVYSKVSQLNTNESDLNKQVFSLLVLGSFMPTAGSSGGGTDYSGLARSSASSILSSQLNALSAQYIKGVEVNFDLQSYNDYASGRKTGNTQLAVGVKKQFFDNRLSVQIGSNIGLEGQQAKQNKLSNFTGNIVVEYKMTKDGNYRLKAFRQNQYEGLIYGVVIKTGAGIIYSRDYNSFSELFKSRDKKE